jgi:hypothetical protein
VEAAVATRVDETYYFVVHAYYHIIGTVSEITGKRSCDLINVRKIKPSNMSWTKLFSEGVVEDCDVLPDGVDIAGWIVKVPWKHPVPNPKK